MLLVILKIQLQKYPLPPRKPRPYYKYAKAPATFEKKGIYNHSVKSGPGARGVGARVIEECCTDNAKYDVVGYQSTLTVAGD